MAEEVSRLSRSCAAFQRFDKRAKNLARAIVGSGTVEWLIIVSGIATFGVAVFTAVQINTDLSDRQEERAERREARVNMAYETLLRRVAGDTGKGAALNLLLASGIDIGGLDMSCEAVGKWEDNNCVDAPVFSNIRVPDQPDMKRLGQTFPRFTGASIVEFDLHGILMSGISFAGATIRGSDLRSSALSMKDVVVERSDLSHASFSPWPGSIYTLSNISGASVEIDDLVTGGDPDRIMWKWNDLWYWSDAPPTVKSMSDGEIADIRIEDTPLREAAVCDAADRDEPRDGRDYEPLPRLKGLDVPRDVLEKRARAGKSWRCYGLIIDEFRSFH